MQDCYEAIKNNERVAQRAKMILVSGMMDIRKVKPCLKSSAFTRVD